MKNTPNYKPATVTNEYGAFTLAVRQYLGAFLGTVQPVEVVKVNGAFVDVLPLIMQINTQNKPVEITDDDIIPNIPAMKFKSGGCEIQYVPEVGDQGLLIASRFDISNYKKTKAKAVVGSFRSFNWADGFFLPLTFASTGGFIIKNQNSTIELTESAINITGGTTNITGSTINLNGNVNLGGAGGPAVARVGDTVKVGNVVGEITSGSSTVTAV